MNSRDEIIKKYTRKNQNGEIRDENSSKTNT
jgi:hypothetical protein